MFFTNAALFANLVPRYPDIKSDLGLSNTAFGSAIAAFPLGALLAGLLAAPLIRRLGSATVATTGTVLLAVALASVPLAGGWAALAGVVLVAGAVDAIVDVAQNAHGLRVQRRYRRSIVNSFHGVWSIGAVTGGLMGSVAAGAGLALGVHVTGAAAIFVVVIAVARRSLLTGPDDEGRPPEAAAPGGPDGSGAPQVLRAAIGTVVVLGLLAAGGALAEDAASSWSALYLRSELGAGAALAGLGFVGFQVAMTTGRLLGDRVVDRFGPALVVRTGGVVAAAGMGAALSLPSVATALAAYALVGLGVATVVPAAMHAADELPGLPAGLGLTVVSWLLRTGFLISAPAVGWIADRWSLRAGLLTVVLDGAVLLVAGRALTGRRAAAG